MAKGYCGRKSKMAKLKCEPLSREIQNWLREEGFFGWYGTRGLLAHWSRRALTPMTGRRPRKNKMASQNAMRKAAQAWCKPTTSAKVMDTALAEAFAEIIDEYREALIWCSGSADFGPEGQARVGWLKIVKQLLD